MGRLVKLTSGNSFLDRVQDQLLSVVNPALDQVSKLAQRQWVTIALTLPAATFPLILPHEASIVPVGVFVAQAIDTAAGTPVSTTVAWGMTGSKINIHALPGLPDPGAYRISFLIVG
jgi:hypothetical protein